MATAPTQLPTGTASGATSVPPQDQVIPDAGVYGAETAGALNAYNNAVAQAAAQRNQLYNSYGLDNQGAVDPNNPYGQYQQMLGAQGQQFQADQANSQERGLGQGGLANQQLSTDRSAADAQDFGFQQSVGQVSQDYNQEMQNALGAKQTATTQAYNDALQVALQNQLNALSNGQYTAPGVGVPDSTDNTPPPPKQGKSGKPGKGKPGHKGKHGGHGGGGHVVTS